MGVFHHHATESRYEVARMAKWDLLPRHLVSPWVLFTGSEPVNTCCHTARASLLAGLPGESTRQFDRQGNTIKSFPSGNARSPSSKGYPDLQGYLNKFC
ncbi:hypothetical protein [Nitrosospira briensis]|uniref:hypothetical protein n=1 Tax=Nitrosospira briensis TaxID=35799 RepID=UPI0004687113|nr:hypothetical protein [Nitrosospira briensis]